MAAASKCLGGDEIVGDPKWIANELWLTFQLKYEERLHFEGVSLVWTTTLVTVVFCQPDVTISPKGLI